MAGTPQYPGLGYAGQPQPVCMQPGVFGPPGYTAQPQQQQQNMTMVAMGMVPMRKRPRPRPSSHLCLAIFSCLCCCCPLGLVSLICAAQVDGAYDRGDYAGAESRSSSAKCWGWAAVIFGLLEIVGIIVYILLLNGAVGSSDVEL